MRYFFTFLLCVASYASFAQQTSFTVYFDSDKAAPTQSSGAKLTALIKELQALPVTSVAVKGYTDKKGANGYNEKLSQQRAAAVATQLKDALPKTVSVTTEAFGENGLITGDDAAQERNRRVELFVVYAGAPTNDVAVDGFFEDVITQRFDVDFSDTVIVRGREGTFIKIAPGSVQTRAGSAVNGAAQVYLKEYYNPDDIVLAGQHSASGEGLLQTGGMFHLCMVQNGDTLSSNTRKKVEIRLPARNGELTGMSVYVRKAESDTAEWDNAGQEFTVIGDYWTWPFYDRLRNVNHFWNRNGYSGYRVGAKVHDEYSVRSPLFGYKPYAKKVVIDFEKLDSATVKVRSQVRYRHYGFKRLGIKRLDTTFYSTRITAQYKSWVSNIGWINCDRFYNTENRTDLYVSTPGYKGLNVVLYFKRLNAFMQARPQKNGYVVAKIPAAEPVIILGFGKRDGDYFLAKQTYFVDRNGLAKLDVKKVTKEKFASLTKGLTVND